MSRRSWALLALAAATGIALVIARLAVEPQAARWPASAEAAQVDAGAAPCEHPYVPTAVGTELEYRAVGPSGEARARMRLVRAWTVGERTVFTWLIAAPGADFARALTLERACDDEGAEEPWVGLAAPVPEVRFSGQTWRLPRDLAAVDRYGGRIDIEVLGLTATLHRTHRVTGSERVDVGGTSYECVRVAIEDWTEESAAPIEAVAWIAPQVGLVRMRVGGELPNGALYELVSVRQESGSSG